MRKLFIIIAAVLLTVNVFAQSPQKMSYQAVIRNSSNVLITSKAVGMQISILQTSATGTNVYTETQTPTTNINGLVSIEIGGGTVVSGVFAAIDWSKGPYFIKTETDPTGGTNYNISGTSQLLSVPYALHAKTVETIIGASGSFTHYVGELYGGGIIVSVWKVSGVEHGLIASLVDLSTSIAWSNMLSSIGITARSPRNGKANTIAIIGQTGHISSAAKLCNDYASGGYSDWYLPAVWELNQCYNVATIVNEVLGDKDGFQIDHYWSSTETGDYYGWCQYFYDGGVYSDAKDNTFRVRAVRRY